MKPIVRNLSALYPEAQLEMQKKRYKTAEVGFAEYFGSLGAHRFFSAPGRTEICGNHTDHNNGKVFAASVDLDVIAVVEQTDDNFAVIKSEGFPEDRIDLSELDVKPEEKNTSASLIRGVARGLRRNGHKIGGFRAYTTSTVMKGSGLSSSAAFEVLVGNIFSHLYNGGQISPVKIAQISQFAENEYFGKPSGLMDQMACSVGGFVAIDFKDNDTPIIESVPCDFKSYKHALCIVDAKGDHADLTDEYAAISREMKAVAGYFDCETLRSIALADVMLNINGLREKFGDRAVLRAIHFFHENDRVERVIHALKNERFDDFLAAVKESGDSSFKYLQNIYPSGDVRNQCLSMALNVAENSLHRKGACRVHGGGFAGTIQAFVPLDALGQFRMNMEKIFGIGSCHVLTIRPVGGAEVLLDEAK
ncbi:MAG: galactokinase [Oscillospiraceae bacterium]|nr:galactokinase [Oscillospiraceae bacterium]